MRLGLSHVPEGREVFPFLSVRENLMMGAYPRKDRDGVAEDLERVYGYFPRLKERINQPAGQLSGGEQQMLAIGRALMNRPTLLLLDEPSLGLSPILVKEIFTIIQRVNEEQGMSILLVEQNAKVALETAHYGYVLEIGRVVMNDTCERLMNSKDIQEFYLGAKEEGARGERRWKRRNGAEGRRQEHGVRRRVGVKWIWPCFANNRPPAKAGSGSRRQREEDAWPDRRC